MAHLGSRYAYFSAKLRTSLNALFNSFHAEPNEVLNSHALLPTKWLTWINNSDFDVVNLHWINGEMLSVGDIAEINKPVVWTLHDMWAFCGSEHVTDDTRWKSGYEKRANNKFFKYDLDYWTWSRKKKAWRYPIQIVTPSRWLESCVAQSSLMSSWPTACIKNPIDTAFWAPMSREQCRLKLGLPRNRKVILFSGLSLTERHKGADLLIRAIKGLLEGGSSSDLVLTVLGRNIPSEIRTLEIPVFHFGLVKDDVQLRDIYGACDLVVVPSRIDNLPNIAVEATACGRPVVAFDTCGLPDIVSHLDTGYLAKPFDVSDLTIGLHKLINLSEPEKSLLEAKARKKAVSLFGVSPVVEEYTRLYRKILINHD